MSSCAYGVDAKHGAATVPALTLVGVLTVVPVRAQAHALIIYYVRSKFKIKIIIIIVIIRTVL